MKIIFGVESIIEMEKTVGEIQAKKDSAEKNKSGQYKNQENPTSHPWVKLHI